MLVVPGVIPGPRRKLFNKETNNNVITHKKNIKTTRTLLVVGSLTCLEPMGLGDKFCCQRRRCCYATFSF